MIANFLLQIDLASRIVLRTPLMTADALLAGILFKRYGGDHERAIRELPIEHVEGVPQASVILPYSFAGRAVEHVKHIRSIMRDMDHDPDLATILDRMPAKSDLTPSEGPLSSIDNTYPTYDIPKIFFIGRGDPDEVQRIVADAAFIGPQKHRGHGQVSACRIRTIVAPETAANKWFGIVGSRNERNMVLRPIPLRLRGLLPTDLRFAVSHETWHNPYFSGFPNAVVEDCAVPLFAAGETFYEAEIERDLCRMV